MTKIKINLLSIREIIDNRKRRRKRVLIFAKVIVFCGIFFMLVGGVFSIGILFSSDSNQNTWRRLPLLSQIQRLVRSAEKNVMGEDDDRINVILFGMGGARHEAGNLTDTIMVVSVKPSTSQAALLSIPRDLIVPIPNHGWRKINSINAFAEQDFPGSGARIAAEIIGKIVLGQPIHYYVRVDFDAFSDFIDNLGGVEVCVERTFDDYFYPIRGQEDNPNYDARYEHLHVEAGCQKMDGDFALKYVRSRHAAWPEGSDFARARRQQILLSSIKEKLLSTSTLLNPKKLSDIYASFKKHVSTNMEIWEAIRFAKMAKDIDQDHIIQKVLDHSQEGLLYSAISSQGAYILQPRSGDFSEIQKLFKNIFLPEDKILKVNTPRINIEIQNGTSISGLAKEHAEQIEKMGYNVSAISNAVRQDYLKTVIYDFTNGQVPDVIRKLREYFNANVALIIPEWLRASNMILPSSNQKDLPSAPPHENDIDVLVILGEEVEFL